MQDDFLAAFLGNSVRARVLRVFVFNQSEHMPLSVLAKRAGTTAQAAEKEIKQLEAVGVIKRGRSGPAPKSAWRTPRGKKMQRVQKTEPVWILNIESRFAPAIVKFVHEVSPIKHNNILTALRGSGRMSLILLSGNFMGDPSRPADLIVAGDNINDVRLEKAVRALEPQFGREIRYACFSIPEFKYRLTIQDRLVRDTLDFPHLVLLDRARIL